MIKLFFNFFSYIHLQGADMGSENILSLICMDFNDKNLKK